MIDTREEGFKIEGAARLYVEHKYNRTRTAEAIGISNREMAEIEQHPDFGRHVRRCEAALCEKFLGRLSQDVSEGHARLMDHVRSEDERISLKAVTVLLQFATDMKNKVKLEESIEEITARLAELQQVQEEERRGTHALPDPSVIDVEFSTVAAEDPPPPPPPCDFSQREGASP